MQDDLLQAIKDATEDEYEFLGVMSGAPGRVACLARERSTGDLVALVLQEDDPWGGGEQFDLSVVRELDDSVPVEGRSCHRCGAPLDAWSRVCDACHRDVSGVASDEAVPGVSRGVLLEEVRSATDGEYEILGSMERSDGGGAVYFARELASGQLAGLSLQEEESAAGGDFTLVVSWMESSGAPDEQVLGPGPALFQADVPGLAEERGYDPREPFAPSMEEVPERRPPPGHRADRRRLLAVGGVGAAAVLVAALLFAWPDAPDGPVPPVAGADSVAASPSFISPDPVPVPPAPPASTGGTPDATATTERPARPRREPEVERAQPAAEAPPASQARPAPSVEAAVARFAQAVQSRDAGRIRSAYPDVTDGELGKWRDHLSAGGQVGYSMQTDPEADGGTAEAVFVLTVRPPGGAPVPMTFRGIFEQANGGWRLKEARSLGGF